ncbi:MAG: flagellar basal body P-ring formation protein FlgA [Nitratireductor sp.]|nr:flagellar basal body P-ring formation protein FlgA [Nitratireductor sp.]
MNGFSVIPVPATMIYAGQRISGSALTTRRVPNRYLAVAAVIVDAGDLEGKTARSTLVPGRPIAVNQVREPNVIDASKPTRIVFRSGGLMIAGEVIPLASAAAGEFVRARNANTGVVVSGVAQPDGSILVAEQ